MRITAAVSASVLVLSALGACGQRDSSTTPPAGTGTPPTGATGTPPATTTPAPAMPAASAASR